MLQFGCIIGILQLPFVAGGRYSDPNELPKLLVPSLFAGIILLLMLVLLGYFYFKKRRGFVCSCKCCKEFFCCQQSTKTYCDCSPARPKGFLRFDSMDSQDSASSDTCRCEKLKRNLEAASLPSASPGTPLCNVCSSSDLIECANCAQSSDSNYPRLLRPDDLKHHIMNGPDVDIDKENLN